MHSGQYWKQENISDDLHIGTFYNTEGSRYVLNLDGTFKYSAREKLLPEIKKNKISFSN